jgi:DNA-binding transcriptional regulator YdaS (Cro superfamily)
VNIALASVDATQCSELARNTDGQITIEELVSAVTSAVSGCR